MIVLPLYVGVTVVMPSMIYAGIFKYWLFALFLVIGLLPPISLGGYFMANALEQNPQKARMWLKNSALAFIIVIYWVGLLFIFETLVPPPKGYGTPTLIWFFADFVLSSAGVILAPRLLKYLKSKSITRT
jgi:hypothetical protein